MPTTFDQDNPIPKTGNTTCLIETKGKACKNQAEFHVCIEQRGNEVVATFMCCPHLDYYAQEQIYAKIHDTGPDCNMPGTLWNLKENRCEVP